MSQITVVLDGFSVIPDRETMPQHPEYDSAADIYANEAKRFGEQLNALKDELNALQPGGWAGGAEQQTIGVDLGLTAADNRKQAISASAAGLSVSLPDESTLSANGDQWIIANVGANAFTLRNHAGLEMGVTSGALPAGEARTFIFVGTGQWLVTEGQPVTVSGGV